MCIMKKFGVSLLAIMMTLSVFLPNVPIKEVEAAVELVNVAPLGTATTNDGEHQDGNHGVANVNDGDITTSWQTRGAWPSTAVIQLDMGRSISEIAVDLGEDGDETTGNTCEVTVKYAINGILSDLKEVGKQTMTVATKHTFKFDAPINASHIYVVLDNPKTSSGATATFWPSIQEIEIYEKRDTSLSMYSNIASQAVITTNGTESQSEGKGNLVDGNESTLYKFHDAKLTTEKYVLLSYEEARKMDAFRIVFQEENPDQYDYQFNFSILAQNSETDGDTWDTIADKQVCNRTDNISKSFTFTEKTYNQIKIVMHSCTNNYGDGIGWPAIAEFEVYGNNVLVTDKGSVANGKPVHTSSGKATASNIVDGNKLTSWKGDFYPAYADIDLEANYDLSAIEVYTPVEGYSQYSIYTSLNGRDFSKLAEKTSKDSANADTGESYDATGTTARYVRVYMEYNSASANAILNEVRVIGTPSTVPAQEYPTLNVPDFEGSAYDVTITAQDTYEEIYGIIDRRLGTTYRDWFSFELTAAQANGYDYFEISAKEGKVHIKGNEGVSITMGLNHYLKYLCNVHISQVGDQVTMPSSIVLPQDTIHMETKAKVRYSYNYCTLSYSMAFYGEKEWRDELDWLALNGANVILDATAQEEVWRRFLGKLGYDHASIKDFVAGPAYYAWAYMANLSGFGGPVHDSWFAERTELARKNQLAMRKLGMEPCLQGYSGMVPTDIRNYDANVNIIPQGTWNAFQRPAMLRTTDAKFGEYAALFYECQKEVYGDVSDYYATDPFHEGGNVSDMSYTDIAREVLTSMLAADEKAIWIIQAWENNPKSALLSGLDQVTNGPAHALVLDLYAEKDPHNQHTGNSYGYTNEFDATPWVYCMLNNFGGRLGLHGHLDNMAREIPNAFNTASHLAGIGITPEASVNNPVLYDFIFESCWVEDASAQMQTINLDTWLKAYATRRYGAQNDNIDAAWNILKDTVYKSSLNMKGQGAPESIVNARPALSISAASTWGNSVISYEKVLLEDALELLLKEYDKFKDNKAYMYDIANVEQQVLSNSAQEVHNRMVAAFNAKDLTAFEKEANTFMEIIECMELVTGTTEYFMLGRWVEQAKALGQNADDFTRDLYEFNAKTIITTWGAINQAEGGRLKDYSNRQWNGLIGDFYKARWQRWINARKAELAGQTYEANINWFEWEWAWARSNKVYPATATPQDLKTLGEEIIEKYTSADPNADASKDIPNEEITSVTPGSAQPLTNGNEGPANLVIDYDKGTIWHTAYAGSTREEQNIVFTFDEVKDVNGMRFLQRSGGPSVNGIVNKFTLYYRTDSNGDWIAIKENVVPLTNHTWQIFTFDTIQAKEMKFQVHDAYSTSSTLFAAAAEIHFTRPIEEGVIDFSKLNAAIVSAQATYESGNDTIIYTTDTWNSFVEAYENATSVATNAEATQEEIDNATTLLKNAFNSLGYNTQVKNVAITSIDYKTIKVNWNTVANATSYEVYRLNTKTSEWLLVTTTTENSYTASGVKTGLEYTYRVRAVFANGEGEYSEEAKGKALLSGETELTIGNISSTVFELNWTEVAGATRYIIYRKYGENAWKKVLTLGKDARSYTSKSMTKGTYYYQIKAARYDSTDRVMTEGSNIVTGVSGFEAPTVTVSSGGSKTAVLTWNQVEGAQYYEVYRSLEADGGYRKIKVCSDLTFTNRSLTTGTTYYYKVQAYRVHNGEKQYSPESAVVSIVAE